MSTTQVLISLAKMTMMWVTKLDYLSKKIQNTLSHSGFCIAMQWIGGLPAPTQLELKSRAASPSVLWSSVMASSVAGSTVRTAGSTMHCVTVPFHSPMELFLCIAITVHNSSNGEWEGPLTWHVVVPAVLTTPPPLATLIGNDEGWVFLWSTRNTK